MIVTGAVVIFGLSGRGPLSRPERDFLQEAVIHHLERASWFAQIAQDYEAHCPGSGREFREMAAWHARRSREYQRMDPADLSAGLEQYARHVRGEGQLMERALKAKLQPTRPN